MPTLPIVKRTPSNWTTVQHAATWQDKPCDESSTDAGSMRSRIGEDDWDPISPVNWRIRNTFLDSPMIKPTLYQGFQRNRRAWSVPAGGREAAEREDAAMLPVEEDDDVRSEQSHEPVLHDMVPIRTITAPVPRCDPPPYAAPSQGPMALSLADLVAPQPPSAGSAAHYQGNCKPCAFFWKVVGCKYGKECQFCHLCDADERKRRNKEKRMAMFALQAGNQLCGVIPRNPRGARVGGA